MSRFLAESIHSREELESLVKICDAYKDVKDEILDILASSGAILRGHFRLESGQHSSIFIRFANVAGSSKNMERIADLLITELQKDRVECDSLLMQEASGRSLGEIMVNKLGKRKLIVETDSHNRPTMNLVNETALRPGDRVLVVSDLSTTGTGLRTMRELLRQKKASPVAVAVFATRNRAEIHKFEREENIKVYALADLAFEPMTYGEPGVEADATKCVECREGKEAILSWET